jgi:hypothetical protein
MNDATRQLRREIGRRLAAIARDRHGPAGGYAMGRELGLSERSWNGYERGNTLPGEILLRFLEVTGVRPEWLLHGSRLRYRATRDLVEERLVAALRNYIDSRGGGREILPRVS